MNDYSTDDFFEGRIKIKQSVTGYRFSIDAVILAAHIHPRPDDRVCDLGTGCAVIPIIIGYRNADTRMIGVEVQAELALLARENVEANGMHDRISILNTDMKTLNEHRLGGPVDIVVSNPPYRKTGAGRLNPDSQRAIARHEIAVTLEELVYSTRRLLRTGGKFVTIYLAERMMELLFSMQTYGITPKSVRSIHSNRSADAKLVLVEGVKNGRPGVNIHSPLFIYSQNGSYTGEIQEMFKP